MEARGEGWRLNEYWQMQQCLHRHNNSDDTAAMVTVDSLHLRDQEVASRKRSREVLTI